MVRTGPDESEVVIFCFTDRLADTNFTVASWVCRSLGLACCFEEISFRAL